MHTTKTLFSAIALTLISACGGGNSDDGTVQPPVGSACSIDNQKQFVVDVMHDTYLYYDQVPEINIADYDTPEEVLEALKVSPDRYSYIDTVENYNNFFEEGTYEGFGFNSHIADDEQSYYVGYVFNDSPVGNAGWQRSDQIIAINGVSAATIIAGVGLSQFLDDQGDAAPISFELQHIDGNQQSYSLSPSLVTMNTVLHSEVVQTNTQKIGYIALSSFIEKTRDELAVAFSQFQAQNVEELVIDLRYNGGGRIRSANHLASQTGGDNTKDFIFARYRHNDKYTSWNTEDSFLDLMQSIDMNRVFVLTGPGTCSASELVINSLSPFLDVVVIGQTTCGKPIGMYGKEFCDKRIVPIEFQVLNHNNEGDYFDGITPSCTQLDDLSKLFGDPDEAMFAHAIHFMNNGQCLPVKQQNKMAQKLPLVKQEVDFIPPEKENH